MDRALPEYNRIMIQRDLQINRRHHKQKLSTITPRIDNQKPSSLNYPPAASKRNYLIEGKPIPFFINFLERCNEIEK